MARRSLPWILCCTALAAVAGRMDVELGVAPGFPDRTLAVRVPALPERTFAVAPLACSCADRAGVCPGALRDDAGRPGSARRRDRVSNSAESDRRRCPRLGLE